MDTTKLSEYLKIITSYLFQIGGIILFGYVSYAIFSGISLEEPPGDIAISAFGGILCTAITLTLTANMLERSSKEEEEQAVATKEELVRENPNKPQLVWELAYSRLDIYLKRNIRQVKSVFVIAICVMIAGFFILIFGIASAFQSPDKLDVGILSSISGLVINFIGGSFLVIFRSTARQAKEYVEILERINAVGMAVQIMELINDDKDNLKDKTRAKIAEDILKIYVKERRSEN